MRSSGLKKKRNGSGGEGEGKEREGVLKSLHLSLRIRYERLELVGDYEI